MKIDNQLINTIIIPGLVGLISWFLKDYIFSIIQKRQEELKSELKTRLAECWSPLFFWSGILITYSEIPNKKEEAVRELEKILAKSANLIPLKHYYELIKLIEISVGVVKDKIDISRINRVRNYIYKQIEMYNFIMYKKDLIVDANANLSLFGSHQALLRLISKIAQDLVTWGILAIYIYAVYWTFVNGFPAIGGLLLLPLGGVIIYDFKKRYELSKEVRQGL